MSFESSLSPDQDREWQSSKLDIARAVASNILRQGTEVFPAHKVGDGGFISDVFTKRIGLSDIALRNQRYQFFLQLIPPTQLNDLWRPTKGDFASVTNKDIDNLAQEILGDEKVIGVLQKLHADYGAIEKQKNSSGALLGFAGRHLLGRNEQQQKNKKIAEAVADVGVETSMRMIAEWTLAAKENLAEMLVSVRAPAAVAGHINIRAVVSKTVAEESLEKLRVDIEDYTGMGSRNVNPDSRATVAVEAQTGVALYKRHALLIQALPDQATNTRRRPPRGNSPMRLDKWLAGVLPGATKAAVPGAA
jgi:hypothetical protein